MRPPDGPEDPIACLEGDGDEPERSDAPIGEDLGRSWQRFGTQPPGEERKVRHTLLCLAVLGSAPLEYVMLNQCMHAG